MARAQPCTASGSTSHKPCADNSPERLRVQEEEKSLSQRQPALQVENLRPAVLSSTPPAMGSRDALSARIWR
ncbi:hypothetical protein PZA11_002557 [Diplocarpon coronariae]